MTLNKAISELFLELDNPNLTEEEKKALDKYKMWLLSIKTTVSNNTVYQATKGIMTKEGIKDPDQVLPPSSKPVYRSNYQPITTPENPIPPYNGPGYTPTTRQNISVEEKIMTENYNSKAFFNTLKEAERKRKELLTWWENTPAGKEYIERELGQMKRMTKIEASNLLFDIGHNCKSLEDDFSLSEALRQLEHYVEETEESYWCTGTPTEKGWYLCVEKGQYTPYMLRAVDPPVDEDDEFDKVIVWHKIPDFKEEKE